MKRFLALSVVFVLMVTVFTVAAVAANVGTLTQEKEIGTYEWAGVENWWRAYVKQTSSCSLGHPVSLYTRLAFGDGSAHVSYGAKVDYPYPRTANTATGEVKVSCTQCGTHKECTKLSTAIPKKDE